MWVRDRGLECAMSESLFGQWTYELAITFVRIRPRWPVCSRWGNLRRKHCGMDRIKQPFTIVSAFFRRQTYLILRSLVAVSWSDPMYCGIALGYLANGIDCNWQIVYWVVKHLNDFSIQIECWNYPSIPLVDFRLCERSGSITYQRVRSSRCACIVWHNHCSLARWPNFVIQLPERMVRLKVQCEQSPRPHFIRFWTTEINVSRSLFCFRRFMHETRDLPLSDYHQDLGVIKPYLFYCHIQRRLPWYGAEYCKLAMQVWTEKPIWVL